VWIEFNFIGSIMSKQHRRAVSNKGNRKSKKKWEESTSNSSTLSGPRVAPDELDVKLLFRKTLHQSTGATNLAIGEFTPNGAYDVDPTLGSTETYGYDEYAALYSYYRVIGYSYVITCSNGGTAPLMAYVTNTNTRVSLSGTRWDFYSTNPYSQSKLLAPTGGAPTNVTFRGRHQVAKILGSRAVETDDSYRATTGANPTDLIWLGIAGESIATAVGIDFTFDARITMQVRFYGREVDLSLAGMLLKLNSLLAAKAQHNLTKQLAAAKKTV
jgi:hypothetical protein